MTRRETLQSMGLIATAHAMFPAVLSGFSGFLPAGIQKGRPISRNSSVRRNLSSC